MTIAKPHVDWFAISPSLSMIGAAGILMMVAVFWPKASRRTASIIRIPAAPIIDSDGEIANQSTCGFVTAPASS